MKILAILVALTLSSCKNLTPEQNDRLLSAGLNLGTAVAVKVLHQK